MEYDPSYLGGPATPVGIEFPFMQTAIDLWEDLLLAGHRVTAVSGSDAKDAAGHGVNATAVYAETLSRPDLIDGLRNGLSTTLVPVPTDPFTVEVPMVRGDDGGPLGTFYRVDVRETLGIRSIVSNPIWLAAPEDEPSAPPTEEPTEGRPADPSAPPRATEPPADTAGRRPLPATGGSVLWLLGISALLTGAVARGRR